MKPASVTLKQAQLRDIQDVRQLFVHALDSDFTYFPPNYRKQVRQQNNSLRLALSLLKKQRIIILAHWKRNLIGYVIGSAHADRTGQLYWLYVSPSVRGQRVGEALMHQAIEEMRARSMEKISLVTYDHHNYYRRFGFEVTGQHHIHEVPVHIMHLSLEANHG